MKGFTLIEILLAVIIIGLLASMAIPAYSAYTIRAKLTEGLINLKSTSKTMKLNFSQTNTYVCEKSRWNSAYFSFECNAGAENFTITATGLGNITAYRYSINAYGEEKTLAHPLGASETCWRIKKPC